MALIFALFVTNFSAWAEDDSPKCESYLQTEIPTTVIADHWDQFQSLLGKFSRIRVEITLSNDIQLQVSSKQGFKHLPIINPNTVERRRRLLVRSIGKSLTTHENTAEDWNLFVVRMSHDKGGGRVYDIISEIGEWFPDSPDEAAMHAINVYTAMSLMPYFSNFIIHIPVFNEIEVQKIEEREAKRICFEKLQGQQQAGLSAAEIIPTLNLPQARFLCEHLPFQLNHVNIAGFRGEKHGVPLKFEDDGYLIELHFKLDKQKLEK